MKKVNLQTLTYDRLEQGEMINTRGGIREDLLLAGLCPRCLERLNPKTLRCPYCDEGLYRP